MTASVQNTRSALAGHVIDLTKNNAFLLAGRTGKKSHYQGGRTVLDFLYQNVAANDTKDGLERGHVMDSAVSVPAIAAATGLSPNSVRDALRWLDDSSYIEGTRNSAREVTGIVVPNLDQLVAGYKPLGRGISGKDGDSVEDTRAKLYDRMTEETKAGAFAKHQAARTVHRWCIQQVDAGGQVVDWMVKHVALNASQATGIEAAKVRKALDWLHSNGFITLTEATGGKHRYIHGIKVNTGKRRSQSRLETAPRKPVVRDLANATRTDENSTRTDQGATRTDVTSSSSPLSPAQQHVGNGTASDLETGPKVGQSDSALRAASGGTDGGLASLAGAEAAGEARRLDPDRLMDRSDEYEAALPLLAWLWDEDGEPRVSLLRSKNGNRQRRGTWNSLKLVKVTGKEKSDVLNASKRGGEVALRAVCQQLHDSYLDPAQPDLARRYELHLPSRYGWIPKDITLFWVGKRSRRNGETPYFTRLDKRSERIVSDEKLIKLYPGEARRLLAIKQDWKEHPDYASCQDGEEAYAGYVSYLYVKVITRPDMQHREADFLANRSDARRRAAQKVSSLSGADFDPIAAMNRAGEG